MSDRKTRELRFYLEYEYNSSTKDMIEDLLTTYSNTDDILTKAITLLHEEHFGSSKTGKPPKYSETLATKDEVTSSKLDELYDFVQALKDQGLTQTTSQPGNSTVFAQLSDEANEKILAKIDELGMRFSKIIPQNEQKGTSKPIATEMSHEEILQLIKRIDQLESKLTRAISQSRTSTAPATTFTRSGRTIDAPPQVTAKKVEGTVTETVERPLLDDVLDTVIVSVDKDEE